MKNKLKITGSKHAEAGWQRLSVITLAILWSAVVVYMHFPAETMVGNDDFYHIQIAQLMQEEGLFIKDFPYATESVWIDAYFDKEWLFHVALVPFLKFGKLTGAKIAIVFFNVLIVLAIWYLAITVGIHRPFWWLLILPYCAYNWYWTRLLMCRPHLLSIAILFLSLALMLKRRGLLLSIVSVLYALSYTGHWQILGLVIIYDIFYVTFDETGSRRKTFKKCFPMAAYCAAGLIVGELLHPNFPNNIRGLYLQNILVLNSYWDASNELFRLRPQELGQVGFRFLLVNFAPILVFLLLALIRGVVQRPVLTRNTRLLGCYLLIYIVLTVQSFRFLEYLVPMSILLFALYFQSNSLSLVIRHRAVTTTLAVMLLIFMIAGLGKCYVKNVYFKRIAQKNERKYARASDWIRDNLEDKEIVYTTTWGATPPLFFGASKQRYLVFLDPYFMYARSPDRLKIWHNINLGLYENPASMIKDIFNARTVFVAEHHKELLAQLKNDATARHVYEGPLGENIFLLSDTPLLN